MAALIMGAAASATGDQVLMFFQPGAAKMLVKGELEKLQRPARHCRTRMYLYDSIVTLEGRFILCELGLPNKGIKKEDLRARGRSTHGRRFSAGRRRRTEILLILGTNQPKGVFP
ncbi:MAG: hypothetical protein MZV63_72190 [Marinilabiliales bacterium]|nr:hypothetical protein [Marinilabiliales bacterium]